VAGVRPEHHEQADLLAAPRGDVAAPPRTSALKTAHGTHSPTRDLGGVEGDGGGAVAHERGEHGPQLVLDDAPELGAVGVVGEHVAHVGEG
jgi:hypothetical protein